MTSEDDDTVVGSAMWRSALRRWAGSYGICGEQWRHLTARRRPGKTTTAGRGRGCGATTRQRPAGLDSKAQAGRRPGLMRQGDGEQGEQSAGEQGKQGETAVLRWWARQAGRAARAGRAGRRRAGRAGHRREGRAGRAGRAGRRRAGRAGRRRAGRADAERRQWQDGGWAGRRHSKATAQQGDNVTGQGRATTGRARQRPQDVRRSTRKLTAERYHLMRLMAATSQVKTAALEGGGVLGKTLSFLSLTAAALWYHVRKRTR